MLRSDQKKQRLCLSLFLIVLWCSGCSEPPPFADVYSNPKDGRIVDFGPQGLYAEKREGTVVVGIWELDGEQLSVLKTTFPQAGEKFEAKVEVETNEVRLRPPNQEIYQTLVRERPGAKPNEALTGLWKQVHERGIDLYEFTPWSTVIWVRFANHTDEERIVGGWGEYSSVGSGSLAIKSGREFDYDIRYYDKYTFEADKFQLKTTNSATKEVKMYRRIERSELAEIAKTQIAFEPQPIKKKKKKRTR